jgi:glycosyltransferase involved in cell wall biosynthesis
MFFSNFYLINFLNYLKSKKYRVGFVINGFFAPYHKVMASTRIRVYDVIKMFFGDKNFLVELYNPLRTYDIVIFQKKFDEAALSLARKLKTRGTKIALDINVNYYDSGSQFITKEQNKDIIIFTKFVDRAITPTVFLQETIKKLFPEKPVEVIEESIDKIYFKKKKISFNSSPVNLIWSGYAAKASELRLIEKVLKELYKKWQFNLILICEKNPHLTIGEIPVYFEKYNHYCIPDQLLKGDIFIAPRDLNDSYNLGHSFTKIGVAMAVGLPVIASPVPSYRNSPAILCENKEEWKENLEKMLNDISFLRCLSNEGRRFVKEIYSVQVIKSKYTKMFKELVKK